MADLLTHVLVAYVLATALSWRVDWLGQRWTAVCLCGAAIPDLVKVRIVLGADVVERVLGVPFTYRPLGTLGGLLLVAGAVAVWFRPADRRRAFASLLLGGIASLVLDGMRAFADGRADFWLYPLWWRPPSSNLYVSSDPLVTFTAVLIAAGVFVADSGG